MHSAHDEGLNTEEDHQWWAVVENHTSDHFATFIDPERWRYATVRWDGCINYHRQFNTPIGEALEPDDCDSIHICDLDEEIERLQQLREMAKKHFGEWPR